MQILHGHIQSSPEHQDLSLLAPFPLNKPVNKKGTKQ